MATNGPDRIVLDIDDFASLVRGELVVTPVVEIAMDWIEPAAMLAIVTTESHRNRSQCRHGMDANSCPECYRG
jgi:hypothetical protein